MLHHLEVLVEVLNNEAREPLEHRPLRGAAPSYSHNALDAVENDEDWDQLLNFRAERAEDQYNLMNWPAMTDGLGYYDLAAEY